MWPPHPLSDHADLLKMAWHTRSSSVSLPSVCGRGRKSKASSIDQIRSLKTPCQGAPSRSGGCQTPSNPWRLKRSPEVLPTQPHYWKGSGPRLFGTIINHPFGGTPIFGSTLKSFQRKSWDIFANQAESPSPSGPFLVTSTK